MPNQTVSVSAECLLEAMVPDYRYTQDEVTALFHEVPKMAVRETLNRLVDRGLVWPDRSGVRVKYLRLSQAEAQAVIDRKTTRVTAPSWMGKSLTGYDSVHARTRALCELARGR